MYPNYSYLFDGNGNLVSKVQNGYIINAYIGGEITTPLTVSDITSLNQTNRFNARGLDISENSWINVYDVSNKDGSPLLYSNAGSSISILNFAVHSANGNYNEFMSGNDGLNDITYFGYNVTWYGDFVSGSVPSGITAPSMATSVPEPGTMVMIATLGIVAAFGIWRKKR
jgi:hypothetical protein